jgi:hypothetical protein
MDSLFKILTYRRLIFKILKFRRLIFFFKILRAASRARRTSAGDHGLNNNCSNNNSPKKQGAGALCSRTSTRRMSSAVSIVQRLTQLEHPGHNLAISIHQYFGYRIHYEWNGKFGNRSFEGRFRSYNSVLAFCTSIASGAREGMCTCITRREEFFDGDLGKLIDMLMLDKLTIAMCPSTLYPTVSAGHGPQSDRTGSGRRVVQQLHATVAAQYQWRLCRKK